MNYLTQEKTMTIREVAEVLKVSRELITQKVKELFPEIVRNGHTTYLNEYQVTELKKNLVKKYEVTTSLEMEQKTLEVMQYWIMRANESEMALNQALLENEDLKPKATYTDMVLQSKSLITTTQIAADLGMSAFRLNQILEELGVQYKMKKEHSNKGQWILKAKYKDCGYTHSKTHIYVDEFGNNRTSLTTYWTEKGRQFVNNLIDKEYKKSAS